MSSNRNRAGLGWMMKLAMAALGSDQPPAILFDFLYDVTDLQGSNCNDTARSIELFAWRSLVTADAARCNFGDEVVLSFDRTSRHAPKHCDLADVGESVGYWSLKQLFNRNGERLLGCQTIVEFLQ